MECNGKRAQCGKGRATFTRAAGPKRQEQNERECSVQRQRREGNNIWKVARLGRGEAKRREGKGEE
jgi:hypothetical protein